MVQQVDAIYEKGVLRPLDPVMLGELQRVRITISDLVSPAHGRDNEFLSTVQAQVAAMERLPSLEEVQSALSKIPGSLVEDFAAEREDRL